MVGERSIHTTHMMAFRNIKPSDDVKKTPTLSIPKPQNRKIFIDDVNVGSINIHRKKDPLTNFQHKPDLCENSSFNQKYFVQIILRYQCSTDQQIPAFRGWNLEQNMENAKERPIRPLRRISHQSTPKLLNSKPYSNISSIFKVLK